MTDLRHFIDGLPKAELHLHIEGSLEPEMLFALAKRNGVSLPFETVEAVRAAYDFGNLQDFLDIYYQGMQVLIEEQDFYDLTWAYLEKARAQNVLHAEIFFDPQAHMERGIAFETVIQGIDRALGDAARELGITSKLIMCFLRHLDQNDAFATLERALDHKDRIVGVGLDSSERGHPPSKFFDVFERARDAGFLAVAHAGEEGPADYVWEALDGLGVSRIDHGNRALDDDALVARLSQDGMPLTVCPLSNLRLCVIDDINDHPLKTMMDRGLFVTVNSDDPSYFGGYVNENYVAVTDALGLTRDDLIALAHNSFKASFLEPAEQDRLVAAVDRYAAAA